MGAKVLFGRLIRSTVQTWHDRIRQASTASGIKLPTMAYRCTRITWRESKPEKGGVMRKRLRLTRLSSGWQFALSSP